MSDFCLARMRRSFSRWKQLQKKVNGDNPTKVALATIAIAFRKATVGRLRSAFNSWCETGPDKSSANVENLDQALISNSALIANALQA